MIVKAISIISVLMTAGCFDARIDFDMARETITKTEVMDRRAYDSGMDGEELCAEGATKKVGVDKVTCVSTSTFDRDKLLSNLKPEAPGQTQGIVHFYAGRAGQFVMIADPAAFDPNPLPEEIDRSMIESVLAGHSIVISLTGATVIQSDGEISSDGRSTELVFPLLDLAVPERAKSLKPLRATFTYP